MVLLSLTSASDARAGILAGGASEVTQVMNKVELIMQTKKIVDQVRHTKQTLQLLRNNAVMRALNKTVIHMMYKRHKMIFSLLSYMQPNLMLL